MSDRDTYTPDSVCNRCGEHYARRVGHSCADITKLFPSLQRVSEDELAKRKEVLRLFDSYLMHGTRHPDSDLAAARALLKDMWGEQK